MVQWKKKTKQWKETNLGNTWFLETSTMLNHLQNSARPGRNIFVNAFSPPYKHIYRSENIVNKFLQKCSKSQTNKKIHLLRFLCFFMVFNHPLFVGKIGWPTRKSPDLPKVRGSPAPVRLDLGSSDATVTLSDPSGKPSGRWQRQWVGAASFGRSEKVGKNETNPVKIHQEVKLIAEERRRSGRLYLVSYSHPG